ncbi:MAG: serine/threonine-protein kinase [Bacteroidota bacterium]
MDKFPDIDDWKLFLKEIDEHILDAQTLHKAQERAALDFERIEQVLQQELGEILDSPLPKGYLIGKFEVVEEIGKGGMSRVYLARRHDGLFDQQVAIKLLSRDLVNEKHQEYFDKERKILARLNHPNISKILDGGITKGGIPYLAMEYVEGTPLDEYLQKNKCTHHDRIAIFLKICEAVRHAHGQLTLHRDLKPSNVFIDREKRIRLLDFGIGGFINEADAVSEGGTLSYLPPEHFDRNEYSVQSDIYQLGLLAFKIFEDKNAIPGSASEEVIQNIKKGNFSAWEKLQSNSTLKAIFSRCLHTNPENRYDTVDALIIDLKFYLEDKPVKALPENWRRNAILFFKRNRISSTFSVLLFVLAIFFAIWSNIQSNRIEKEKQRALAANEFLNNIFEANDPNLRDSKEEITVAMLLKNVDSQLQEIRDPDVKADMINKMAEVYTSLRKDEKSLDLTESVIQLYNKGLLSSKDEVYDAYFLKATNYWNLGQIQLADSVLGIPLAWLDPSDNEDKYRYSDFIYLKANNVEQMGLFSKSDSLARKALELVEGLPTKYFSSEKCKHESPEIHQAVILGSLCQTLLLQTKMEEALKVGLKSLELMKTNPSKNYFNSLVPYVRLSEVYEGMSEYEKQLEYAEHELKSHLKVLDLNHPRTWGSMRRVAAAHHQLGNLELADSLFSFAYEKYAERYGPFSDLTLASLFSLVLVKTSEEYFTDAKDLMLKVLKGDIENLGETHVFVGDDYEHLGVIHSALEEFDQARKYYNEAEKIFRMHVPEENERFVTLYTNLGDLNLKSGNWDQSLDYLNRTLNLSEKLLGEDHRRYKDAEKLKQKLLAKMSK